MSKIGVIGGSGLYEMDGFKNKATVKAAKTPFGYPSDDCTTGKIEGTDVVFLSRHGQGHRISPSEINYRANIFMMKTLGVDAIISVSACGSLRKKMKPMDFVVPDQFVDRTNKARESSFFTGGIVAHVALADPISPEVASVLIDASRKVGVTVHEKGTYINMEGPQFSTRAESHLYRAWGMDIIGMTNMAEAKLAREAEIAYASLASITDYDCWHESHESVTIEMILTNLKENIANAKKILKIAIPQLGKVKSFTAANALQYAIVTNPSMISAKLKQDLKPIIGKYIK